MEATEKLRDLAVSESGFVFDPYTGATFSVNATGAVLLEGLKQGHGREALVAALRERFDVQGEDLARDVDEFLSQLKQQGVLPTDFEG